MPVQQTPAKRMATRSRWCRLPRRRCSHRCSHRRKACKSRCRYLARHSPDCEADNGLEPIPCAALRCGAAVPGAAGARLRNPCRHRENAPREIRTPTVQTDHKALNLAPHVPPVQEGRSRTLWRGSGGVGCGLRQRRGEEALHRVERLRALVCSAQDQGAFESCEEYGGIVLCG
jgi:hypothetical protein